MEDELVEDEHLTLEQRSVLPNAGFFVLDSLRESRTEQEVAERIDGCDRAMLVDGDADGLGAVVVARRAFPDDEVAYVPTSPNGLHDDLAIFAEHVPEDVPAYVVDLALDDVEAVEAALDGLVERAASVHWYDHHQWDDAVIAALEERGIEVAVGDSDEVCSADVTLQELEAQGHALDDDVHEFVAVTRDQDLWIKEDPRSDDLADLSVYLDDDEYVDAVLETGVDFDEETRAFLEEKREEKRALIELAVERASFHEVADTTIAQTYGRCSQNEVAEELRQRGADAVTVVKPEGGVSFRGSDGFERCHEVAGLLDGGGHPKAAGCKPDVFDTMLDFARHWLEEGAAAREATLDAYREILGA